jgi:hypothetical protein
MVQDGGSNFYYRNVDDMEISMIVMSIELNLPLSKQDGLKVAQRRERRSGRR